MDGLVGFSTGVDVGWGDGDDQRLQHGVPRYASKIPGHL